MHRLHHPPLPPEAVYHPSKSTYIFVCVCLVVVEVQGRHKSILRVNVFQSDDDTTTLLRTSPGVVHMQCQSVAH